MMMLALLVTLPMVALTALVSKDIQAYPSSGWHAYAVHAVVSHAERPSPSTDAWARRTHHMH